VAYHEILLKLMDGITDIGVRADIVTAFSYIVEAYRIGKIDDDRLRRDLNELCLDILSVKYPTKDVEELRGEAEEWAEKLYRAVKMKTARERSFIRSGLRE
jgi:hypothetical protein